MYFEMRNKNQIATTKQMELRNWANLTTDFVWMLEYVCVYVYM